MTVNALDFARVHQYLKSGAGAVWVLKLLFFAALCVLLRELCGSLFLPQRPQRIRKGPQSKLHEHTIIFFVHR
jgi:hypothetical protein